MTMPNDAETDTRAGYRRGPRALAVATAALTFPLLLVGGAVTVYRVGMAVPDWPTTFGVNMFLYNFLRSTWGVQLEHTHRLAGSLVGLSCIALASWTWATDRRGWMRGLGVLALAAVIGQGVLGGLRVTRTSAELAFVHGCTAELFFALVVALCVFTGRDWIEAGPPAADRFGIRRKAATLVAMTFAQIVMGATVRHFGWSAGVMLHATLSGAVALMGAGMFVYALGVRASTPGLLGPARWLVGLIAMQIALGVAAWWLLRPFDGVAREVLPAQALVRIAHQGLGALVLAASVVLALRSYRHLAPVEVEATHPTPASAARPAAGLAAR